LKSYPVGDLALLPERAVWSAATRTLWVADLHLGKGAAFRAGGAPAPVGISEMTLRRLGAVCDRLGAARLIALGDFLHARESLSPRLTEMLVGWRRERAGIVCVIVRGNHDRRAGDPPAECGFICVDEPFLAAGVEGRHYPLEDDSLLDGGPIVLAGHEHPVARLGGPGRDTVRLPCFVIEDRQIVLPAFGEFTGGSVARPRPGATIVVTTDSEVFAIPQRTRAESRERCTSDSLRRQRVWSRK
jgi:DNA ligase-associated metallophosphoesterase